MVAGLKVKNVKNNHFVLAWVVDATKYCCLGLYSGSFFVVAGVQHDPAFIF